VVKKIGAILKDADIPAIVVSQTPLDFEDFAEAGIRTRSVKPKDEYILTRGKVMEIVTGITRGETCPRDKLNVLQEGKLVHGIS
jgi:methyl-coenzyme M reductase subunit C